MNYIKRSIKPQIDAALARGKSILMLGARQTGKTTLANQLNATLSISFIRPDVRQRYESNIGLLAQEIEALPQNTNTPPLVVIDEVQKIPEVMDIVQDLIDRKIAQFVLTGSSARKLKRSDKINLLPGRVVVLHLDPLTIAEMQSTLPTIEDLILYGSLPEITLTQEKEDKEIDLLSYVTTYLEEEIRAEAVVRNVNSFSQFLQLAACESGKLVNFNKLSQEIGVAQSTITSYYQILEDCLIAERIMPLSQSKTRKRLIKTPKYAMFDLGVRRLAAKEGIGLPAEHMGYLFEEFVGLELIRLLRLSDATAKVYFWQDANGPEVDWVIERQGQYIPIEVKWTDSPKAKDARHLKVFLDEYSNAEVGYIVCQTPRPLKISDNIQAIPWQLLAEYFA